MRRAHGLLALGSLGAGGIDLRTLIMAAVVALSAPCALAAAPFQDAPPPIEAARADLAAHLCELHVWPAPALQSVTEGWWHADPVRRPSMGSAGADPAVLPAERQLAIMPAVHVADALRMPLAQIIPHAQPLPRAAIIQPVAPTSAECAAELILQRSIYEKGVLSSGSIRVFATVRRWDKGRLAWSYTGLAASDVPGFPPIAGGDAASSVRSAETAWSSSVVHLAMQAIAKHPTP